MSWGMSQPHLIVQPVHPALVVLVRHDEVTPKNGLNSPFLKREVEVGIYKPCQQEGSSQWAGDLWGDQVQEV